jgi:hypothetical protein
MGNKLPVIFLILVGAIGVQIWLKASASAGALGYYTSWEKAANAARSSEKPMLLNFGGPW